MRKKFITNLGFLLLINLLIKPFWIFGIDRTVQNVVGTEEYGLYFTLFNFSLLFNIILDAGVTNFNNRNISQHNYLLGKHFSKITGLKFFLGFVYIVVLAVSAIIVDYGERQLFFLFLLGINQFLASFILYLRSNISALHLFKIDSILSVTDKIVMILICSVLLFSNAEPSGFKIEWLIYSQTVAFFFTAIVAFITVLYKSEKHIFNFDFKFLLIILKNSYPYALLVLLMTAYSRTDSVLLERLLPDGKTQAGIYAHGYRILDAAAQYAYLFAAILLPIFSKMLKNSQNIHQLLKLSFLLLFVPASGLAVGSFYYGVDIIYVLYDSYIDFSAQVFSVLILGFIPISVSYIFGTLLTANGNLKLLNYTAFAGVIINLTVNVILIPQFGALGAAWSNLVTQILMAVVQTISVLKIFKILPDKKFITAVTIYTILLFVFGYFISNTLANRPLGLMIIFLYTFLSAAALKLLSLKYLYKILKYDE